MSMTHLLSEVYGNQNAAGPAEAEGTQKFANAEAFAKLAADNNIDLSQYTPEQTLEMYNRVFEKTASAQETDPDAEKRAAAEQYVQEKRAHAEKVAAADMMGRIMARSMMDELGVIQQEKLASEKVAQFPPQFMKKKEAKGAPPEKKEEEKDEKEKEKTSAAEAFEALAVERAVKLAEPLGYNTADVRRHVEAVRTLNLLDTESQKVASVLQSPSASTEAAIDVRALEYLEKVGFDVKWDQVFGPAK